MKLTNLFRSAMAVTTMGSPSYGEKNIKIRVRTSGLLWEPSARLVHSVLVDHTTRGRMVLMCSDLKPEPSETIRLYRLRFKIEPGFKLAAPVNGA